MKAAQNGRVLRIAIAASLAVHLTLATLVHPRPVQAQPPQQPSPATIFRLVQTRPTLPPTPAPQPRKRASKNVRSAHSQRPPIHSVHIAPPNRHDGGVAIAIASAAPGTPEPPDSGTGTTGPQNGVTDSPPTPAPTPKPACSAPELPARAVTVESPALPENASADGVTAKIRVDLDASGNVRAVSVYESAGSFALDRAALDAARASTYSPEEINCKNVSGSYLFTVDFSTM